MSATQSTREKILSIFNDIEIITKQMLENVLSSKHQKTGLPDQLQLTKLLIAKSEELKDMMKFAEEQAKINEIMNNVKSAVEKQDQYIRQFEKQLKDAEQLLATANFQAKQKLASIDKANKRPVPSEELIKYAHRISSSEAICAPLSWQPGDPRRPYPTEIDMRLGLLSRYNDPPNNGHMIPPQAGLSDIHRTGVNHPSNSEPPVTLANQFSWHPSNDMHINVSNQGSIDTRNHKDAEDVEVMSTDSSSSSSSDSQ